MRKNFLKLLVAVVAMLFWADAVHAADPAVKQEFRSTWLATVWRLDWPSTTISSTGNAAQIATQKHDLTIILDSLKNNNFNAINFQVRSRSDAMYKSSYEPWSSDLVSQRGMDPGWDPLAFAVEECHKRGMECHAWINPYRYESVTGAWGKDDVYRKDHPEWLLDIKGASILNPGLPEVTQRICDIVREIVTNYDIDGMLFDDYFYLSGVTTADDGELFEKCKANDSTITNIYDWRRANVNNMVKQVYNTIQEVKPWVRFGVGPAGIACTDGPVARKYGISICPTGRDWQYDEIFSDPIAWYAEQSVDYMAPQIYWTIENTSPNYVKATKWWSEVAAKFNRQMYVSHSISSLNSLSEATPFGMSHTEAALKRNKIAPKADGPHNTNFYEFSKEVKVNREESLDGAPGSVFYSTKYLYSKAIGKGLLANHLRQEVFTTPAIVPAMTHKRSNNPGLVTEIRKNGNTLTWKGFDNMRYTVYAVPESEKNFTKQAEYLLGITYETSYEIPASKTAGYRLAVCPYDRLGYEYSAAFMGEATKSLDAPRLLSPVDGVEIEAPVTFTWTEVADAIIYNVDLASDPQFNDLICSVATESSTISSAEMHNMPMGQTLYWRVRASGNNANDGISATQSFRPDRARFTYPAHQQKDVDIRPEFTWTPEEHNISLEIATTSEFDRIFYTAELQGGKHALPFWLAAGTEYHARFHYVKDGATLTSPVVSFTTKLTEATTPEVISPIDGGTFYGDETIKLKNIEGSNQVIYYIATSASGLSRGSSYKGSVGSSESCPIGEIPSSKTFFKDGKTYYFKVTATYQTVNGVEKRESPVFSATYLGASGVEAIEGDAAVSIEDNKLILGGKAATVNIYSVDGRLIKSVTSAGEDVQLDGLASGIYLIKLTGDITATLKHQIL
ncbi:MAG: family 10 glycosylhydrolase [Muribaculaceae bacterium]|nr:family 10 glycosylhydrolase [Muribaculaceae bacterium]